MGGIKSRMDEEPKTNRYIFRYGKEVNVKVNRERKIGNNK